jgi:hypothetical protein
MIARWRRRWDLFLTGLLGAPCRYGCGQRLFAADVRAHEDTNHDGDDL